MLEGIGLHMKSSSFCMLALPLLLLLAGCRTTGSKPLAALQSLQSLPVTNQAEFWLAAEAANMNGMTPVMWNALADDERQARWRRRLAVVQLAKQVYRKNMTLKEFVGEAGCSKWPKASLYSLNTPITGGLPYNPGNDPLYRLTPIQPVPVPDYDDDNGPAFFFSLDKKVPVEDIPRILSGDWKGLSRFYGVRITNMGVAISIDGYPKSIDFSTD